MKELSLQEIKDIEFEMLKVFRSFCEKNNIKYYLSHGTLLGAIRYNGFIPWDDDVDLLVPRSDYNRLIAIFKDDEKYRLFSPERNTKYGFPYAKLSDMTTRKEETGIDNGVHLGVDIDVFPLDAWDDNINEAKKEAKRIRKSIGLLTLSKKKNNRSSNMAKQIIIRGLILCCKIFGSSHYIKKIIKESYKTKQTGGNYLGCKVWCVYGERGIIPAEVFADTTYVEFEGEMFPAPAGYDTYLACLYGDYMPEPPVEKRKTHHNFKAYRL